MKPKRFPIIKKMKAQKQVLFSLELQGDEVQVLMNALEKIIHVETAITPNVIKILDMKETKLIEEIFKEIKK